MKIPELPFSERDDNKISFLIIHCCAFSPKKAVQSFIDNDVSAHYIISGKGKVYHLVDDRKCAWHAGKSFWKGQTSLNKNSIGIELSTPSLGQNKYSKSQITALISLLKNLQKKYSIAPQNILGHSDIAPNRKPDPGRGFPWKILAENGLGLWYRAIDADKIKNENLAELLQMIGYDTSNLEAAICAFCRHFYPSRIAKINDIYKLLDFPFAQNIKIDKRLVKRMKAVAYAYIKASKKPCKI